ncbi:CARDB domain-containing protein [Methanobrevibacter arboriphilus]|uniref:CARDB domain-containing protein n=1 Tax=Methanobrevibacter arboriphilus TaxID=39441 RepID=UPI000AB646CA|nr:CARDB domain-containing protein [Methanobrevibacter arboriphilus]
MIITHVKKSGNYKYKITVKNQGESTSKASKLKIWFGKKYKIVKIGSIDPNKSKTINVNFFKYSTHKKIYKIC